MTKPILILLIFISGMTFGQNVSAPYQMSNNELLSNDAYQIFKTNKFLDYKEKDSLIEIINNKIYEKTELNNYFGYKVNWAEIEKEDTITYRKPYDKYALNQYSYSYTDSTMTQHFISYVSNSITRKLTTIYNLKGFVIYDDKKTYFDDSLYELESTTNVFDDKNRAIKIIKRTDRKNKEENQQNIIEAIYGNNTVTVKSENGTMICKFIKDENSVGYISKLSPRETASNFMYALGQRSFDFAKEYCTDKMIDKLKVMENLNNQIVEVSLVNGSGTFSDTITIKDIWDIKFSTSSTKEKYHVTFIILKQKNGWKIDEFKIE